MSLFASQHQFPNFQWPREIALLLLINTLIAFFLSVVEGPDSFLQNLLISHCIGICIGLINFFLCKGKPAIGWSWRSPIAVILGILAGFKLSHLLGAPDILTMMVKHPDAQWRWVAIALMVSFAACAFFVVFYHSLAYKNELEMTKRQHAEARQAEITAQLAMLQAQIEPHFLFNTLANVHSLITRDPALAQTMLEHLNNYLRASLSRTRQPKATLADELELISTLLAISQIRLGERLRYRINIADDLLGVQLPPLLLQPLVENALEHGIEPAILGGDIVISATTRDDQLLLRVTDTGLGLQDKGPDGIGLTNVRARLASLYGEHGRLALYPNTEQTQHGVIAELTLPIQRERQ